jgi:ABC-type multidrug transport system fused ATPase/permease subunit
LIAGLETPRAGRVLVDGRPLVDWPRAALAARMAMVRQEVMLFEGSFRDNLTLWDPALPEPDMIRAARDAQIHEVIAARPGGYDALIAEGGGNFSGGEKQRIEIARALALNPSILILDEATSALDPVTEYHVLEAIRRRGITCVLIAHRLSAIRDCDTIVVLERGQVVEAGDHAALIASGGHYARLVEA